MCVGCEGVGPGSPASPVQIAVSPCAPFLSSQADPAAAARPRAAGHRPTAPEFHWRGVPASSVAPCRVALRCASGWSAHPVLTPRPGAPSASGLTHAPPLEPHPGTGQGPGERGCDALCLGPGAQVAQRPECAIWGESIAPAVLAQRQGPDTAKQGLVCNTFWGYLRRVAEMIITALVLLCGLDCGLPTVQFLCAKLPLGPCGGPVGPDLPFSVRECRSMARQVIPKGQVHLK